MSFSCSRNFSPSQFFIACSTPGSWVSCITVLCNIPTECLPVKNESDITTLYTLIIVTSCFYRASACYACKARYCFTNSVRLSAQCQYAPVEMDILSHFWHSGRGIIPVCATPPTKIPMGTTLAGAVNTVVGIFFCNFRLKLYIQRIVFPTGCTENFVVNDRRPVSQQ